MTAVYLPFSLPPFLLSQPTPRFGSSIRRAGTPLDRAGKASGSQYRLSAAAVGICSDDLESALSLLSAVPSFTVPARSERLHGGFAGQRIPVRWLAVSRDACPRPGLPSRRSRRLEDAPHDIPVSANDVEVVRPLSGSAASRSAAEMKVGHG